MAKATGRKAPTISKATPRKKAAAVKKAAPVKAAAKKTAAKKAAPTKAGSKKAAPAKSAKAAAKKTSSAKKPVPTKPLPTKAVAGKIAAAKTPAKKAAPAKAVVKKAVPAKSVAKKPAPAKKAVPEPKVPVKKQPAGKTCALSGIFVPKQSPNITPKTLEKLRELLLEEREHHVRQAADLQADAEALVNDREQGDTQFDEESGEGDTISVERERDLMLSATAHLAVDEIDLALERMKAGTYGLCTPAGRRIPVARLEAIPWADTCVDCKQRVERRR
jgi:RNA polymerase-binding transcription factor DksA